MRSGSVAVACALVGLLGCAAGSFSGVNQSEGGQKTQGAAGARLTGAVHGGQNPISGARVYLFAAASGASGAGQAAYGGNGIAASSSNASQSLLTSGLNTLITPIGDPLSGDYYVTTGADGSFSISSDYACAPGQQVYLYSLGGDPGLGTGVNAAAGLMAALGNCPTAGTFPSGMYVIVNEVSTVAAAYAMAGFATDATHVGSSGTALALTGIANAFANAANLAVLSTGSVASTTAGGNGTVPQAEINTLANILAACVNSNGAGPGCTSLFANATVDGTTAGAQPSDTATAAINIAHNPAANIANLYALASATPPFAPPLSAAPNDFTVAIGFTGGGIYEPFALAIDASGNAWITSFYNRTPNLVKLSSTGVPLSGVSGFTGSALGLNAIAIDQSGNAWVGGGGGTGGDYASKFSSSGVQLSPSGGFGAPDFALSIAIDKDGNIWIPGLSAAGLEELSNSGSILGYVPLFESGQDSYPYSIAIDGSGNLWVAANSSGVTAIGSVIKVSSLGTVISGNPGYSLNNVGPLAIAVDSSGNAWTANWGTSSAIYSISKLSNSGVPISGANGYTGGGVSGPSAIAIDGAGNVWVTNVGNILGTNPPVYSSSISEFSNSGVALSGPTGYIAANTAFGDDPGSIAIDGSGDVWIPSPGGSALYVTELIGAAVPVITPIAAGLPATPTVDGSSNLGTRP